MKEKHLTIKQLPISERPYEKCQQYGVKRLSDAELLAVIIRTGTKKLRAIEVANNILNYSNEHSGLIGLNYLSLQEMMQISGIGKVKSIQLLCITELTKRMARETRKKKRALLTPEAVAEYYMQDMRHLEYEQVILLLIDTKNHILKDFILSKGTINASLAEPRDVYRHAIKYGAVSVILLHNHPSGDSTPSKGDIALTHRMKKAGDLVGINLLDHIILGDNNYVSLKERNII